MENYAEGPAPMVPCQKEEKCSILHPDLGGGGAVDIVSIMVYCNKKMKSLKRLGQLYLLSTEIIEDFK